MIMALFLGILGIFTLLEYKNACIRYDEKQVQVVNYKGNAKCFEWTDLNSVAVNGFTNRIVFRTKKGKVSCNQFMKGVNIFLVEAEAYSGISTAKALLQLNPFNSKTTW